MPVGRPVTSCEITSSRNSCSATRPIMRVPNKDNNGFLDQFEYRHLSFYIFRHEEVADPVQIGVRATCADYLLHSVLAGPAAAESVRRLRR